MTSSPLSLADLLGGLPARIRVHELAKRAGRTSKEVLAALSELGAPATSASSTVPAELAGQVLTGWFPEDPPTPPAPAPDAAPVVAADPVIAPEGADPDTDGDADADGPRSPRRRRGRSGTRRKPATADPDQPELVSSDLPVFAAPEVRPEPAAPAPDDAADPDANDRPDIEGDPDTDAAGRRRRRRGRRGRSRSAEETSETDGGETDGPGPADGADTTDEASDHDETPDVGDGEESAETGDGASRRRRRRRRRSTGSDEQRQEDDPDNTVVHVREPARAGGSTGSAGSTGSSEVQGIRGSTRLEAKRQRRRDTRDSRRRPQILTEAEFLARREAVDRVMAVRQRGDLAQVALLEDNVLVEHFVSRAGTQSLMGTIFLGRVQNVLPSMEAAFVDIGRGRNAVLYAGEVNWDAAGLAGKARRIETALSPGDTLLVQVSKDPVGQKGARLTTQISLPGRFLVYVPGGGATGISRKLSDTERKRLKSILDRIVPEDAGVIIRTAAEGAPEDELIRDVERLQAQWTEISQAAENRSTAPVQLSVEPDTLTKVVRDLFNSDINRLVVDGDEAYASISSYVEAVAPELAGRVSRHDGSRDVFAAYRIDEQIAKALERKVHLPSGGSLVIDRTEAMTVVDVNTGKYTGSGGNLEETVTKNNLEAAEEIVRQLRLRDIGGIIVVDFIDMVVESNRDLVLRRLTECLGRDRTRHQVAEVTSLGLVQMTRKKMGTGLVEAFSEPCAHCAGRGIVLRDVPMDKGAPEDVEDGGRGGRNRRGRARVETPPEPKAVAAVRPPDPRGPKPPGAGHDPTLDPTVWPEQSDDAPAVDDPDVVAAASDAVSAVLAALDSRAGDVRPKAEIARDGAASLNGESTPESSGEPAPESALEPVPEPVPPAARPRRRRAASRPAGPAGVPVEATSTPSDG